jgi:hypothetical protein
VHASTIERHDARPSNTLIRTYGGHELPAVGEWIIGAGQRVTLIRKGLRRRKAEATVFAGRFIATDDPSDSTMELALTLPETPGLIRITRDSLQSLDVRYHGVFHQRNRVPSMWLSVTAVLAHDAVPQLSGHGRVVMLGELNLNPAEVKTGQPR